MGATVIKPPVTTAHTQSGWGAAVVLGLALFLGLGFVAGFAFPYFAGGEELARYPGRQGWLFLHLGGGMIALLVGPGQLWLGHKNRRIDLHRTLGLVYMASIAVSVTAAFYLATHTSLGWVFGAGLSGLAVAWIVTTGLAYAAVRRGLLHQHQEWMIRSYVVTFGFVFFRILVGVLQATGVGSVSEQLNAASWFCWAAPLLVTEAILQGRKIFAVSRY
jgi:predicted membrane protein DUF2306